LFRQGGDIVHVELEQLLTEEAGQRVSRSASADSLPRRRSARPSVQAPRPACIDDPAIRVEDRDPDLIRGEPGPALLPRQVQSDETSDAHATLWHLVIGSVLPSDALRVVLHGRSPAAASAAGWPATS
jgi:hypothetical protein